MSDHRAALEKVARIISEIGGTAQTGSLRLETGVTACEEIEVMAADAAVTARAALAALSTPQPEGMETTEEERAEWLADALNGTDVEFIFSDDPTAVARLLRDFDRLSARLAPVEDAQVQTMLDALEREVPSPAFEKLLRDLISRLWRGKGEAGTPAARWRENGEPDPHGAAYDCERAKLAGGHLTDDEVAFQTAMLTRDDLNHEGVLNVAKDRIRWLSRKLVEAATPKAAKEE